MLLFVLIQILIEHPVSNSREPDQTLHSAASDLGLHCVSMSHKKDTRHTWVKYFCCVCYSHKWYSFFLRLDNLWIKTGFNHMDRHDVCHMLDRNRYN